MEEITKIVADFYGMYYKVLLIEGRSNQKQAIAKQMAMILISEFYPRITLEAVGAFFNRKHSTIVHGKKAMYNELQVSRKRKLEYNKLKAKVEAALSKKECANYCQTIPFKILK